MLEQRFLEEASAQELDVCAYRVFMDESRPLVSGLAAILGDFQKLFSLTYASVHSKQPRERVRIGIEAATQTSFGFAYTYSGSVGFVLTLPNDQSTLFDTDLDEAMNVVFSMAKSPKPEQIVEYARQYGPGPVRALFNWASHHADHSMGADIEWRRVNEVRASLFIQPPELRELRDAIALTSDVRSTKVEVAGELVGIDVDRRTFHLRVEKEDYIGLLSDDIRHAVEVPKHYHAMVEERTITKYSTDEEKTTRILLSLRD
ncbi:hypothetical protein [uncultured Paludibaculum sp.]|uniref:hypothetical protein n=1 Tax=uncultured Paludibaculum sp. TaxID=1765020 RepID=UPI002AAAAB82|nr:hypothetical protein [uncultured Paludibaculum sp.]